MEARGPLALLYSCRHNLTLMTQKWRPYRKKHGEHTKGHLPNRGVGDRKVNT